MHRLCLTAILTASLFIFFGCSEQTEQIKVQFFGEAQGTYYAVTYFAPDTLVSQQEIDSIL